MEPLRIATMLPSATEIVCALGYRDSIVATSHECDYPSSIRNLPSCTDTKIDITGNSLAIDQQVKSLVEQGLSVYKVDAELIRSLKPNLVVTQTQCEVCAASPKDLEDALTKWVGGGPSIISLEPNYLEDVWKDIEKVAAGLENPQAGLTLIAGLERRIDKLSKLVIDYYTSQHLKTQLKRPRVGCIEWIDPLMAAGNWVPELVRFAGGQDVFGEAGKHSPWLDEEAIIREDPDIIIFMPCGYNIKETLKNLPTVTNKPWWNKLNAVREKKVFVVDGNQYFNRPGPRLVESLEILLQLILPEVFLKEFNYENVGWIKI